METLKYRPPQGTVFADILAELHQTVFEGLPDDPDPYVLPLLAREHIAYALSCYYQCEHCQKFHAAQVEKLQRESKWPTWRWQEEIVRTILFLRIEQRDLSEIEWGEWLQTWNSFSRRIGRRHENLGDYIALAVGIARNDGHLMELAIEAIAETMRDRAYFKAVIRDIDRVVVFMKAATSKNRTDPIILRLWHKHAKKLKEE